MASYRVQIWSASATDFSPDQLVAEIENPKNLGYASYLNDIPEAFFTVNQYDAKANIRAQEGKGHVFIIRDDRGNSDCVWRGILAEHDANSRDVIFYAYGYEHLLHNLYSTWHYNWKNAKIAGAAGRPIDKLWQRAKDITDSPVQWITTGTTQAPAVDSDGTTDLVLNRYRTRWRRILTAMKELTAIATSDTTNIVYQEIDFPVDPTDQSATFNYWKDRSSDATDIRLAYNDNVMDYSDRFIPVMFKNDTLAVGTGPRNQLYRFQAIEKDGTYGRDNFGHRMQNMYYSWVRDRAELKRVAKRRLRLALREDVNLWVRCYPDSIPPWRSTASSHRLGDRIYTEINHGVTRINKWLHMMGEQVVFVNGREYVQPILEERTGDQTAYTGMTWIGPTSTTMWERNDVAGQTYVEHTVTIPDDTRVVMLCTAQSWWHGTFVSDSYGKATLDGVDGTYGIAHGADQASYKKVAGVNYYWTGADAKAGQTVTLRVNHYNNITASYTLLYGLLCSSADIANPAQVTTAFGNAVSGGISATMDSGANSAIGVTVTHLAGSAYTIQKANSTEIINYETVAGAGRTQIWYETLPQTGSRQVGGEHSAAGSNHAYVGWMFSNE